MPDQQYTIEFQTISDVSKAEQLKRALDAVAESQKKLGIDAKEYEQQSKTVEQSLESQTAKALKLDEALRKAAEAAKAHGIDSSPIEAQRAANRQANNLPELSVGDKMIEKAKEILEAYRAAGGGIEGIFAALENGAGRLIIAFTVLKTMLDLIKESVHEFEQVENAMVGLDQALKNIGQDTDEVRHSYKELAGAMEEATNIASSKWLTVLERLTQFGALPETINKDAEAVKNLAGIVGDLDTATMLVTRALQGHFEAFTRYGIVVDEAGTKTEKLDKLYEQFAQRGAGMLEAKAETLTGKFEKLHVVTSNILEGIGNLISRSGMLQFALDLVAASLESLLVLLPNSVERLGGLNERMVATANNASTAADQMKKLADEVKNTAEATERLNTHLTTQLQIQQTILRLRDEQSNSLMARALARVDAQVQAGTMRPEAAAIARVNIREYYRQQQDQNRATDIGAQIRTAQAQRDELADDVTWAAQNQQDLRDRYAQREELLRDLGRQRRVQQAIADRGESVEGVGPSADALRRIQQIDAFVSRLPQLPNLEETEKNTQQLIKENVAKIQQLEAQLVQLRAQQASFEATRQIDRDTRMTTGVAEVERVIREGGRADIASQLDQLNRRIDDRVRGGTDPVSLYEQQRRLRLRDLELQPDMRPEERRNQRDEIQRQYNDSIRNNRFGPDGRLRPMTSNVNDLTDQQFRELTQTIDGFMAYIQRSSEYLRNVRRDVNALSTQLNQDRSLQG